VPTIAHEDCVCLLPGDRKPPNFVSYTPLKEPFDPDAVPNDAVRAQLQAR
jgi:hypothetical protein